MPIGEVSHLLGQQFEADQQRLQRIAIGQIVGAGEHGLEDPVVPDDANAKGRPVIRSPFSFTVRSVPRCRLF